MTPSTEARKMLCPRVKRNSLASSLAFIPVAAAATATLDRLIILPMTPPLELDAAISTGFRCKLVAVTTWRLPNSDTSANALFGNLQVVTATSLHLNPVLMAASNSSGGVMGKMISLSSVAVAAAATGMKASDEAKLFRFTLGHSIFLASVLGVIVVIYAYVLPQFAP